MKLQSLLFGLFALQFCACAAVDEAGSAGEGFETEDSSYALGERVDAKGDLVNVEVIFDASSSYLTPQSPNTSWIVDRAVAHTQQRPLLLDDVAALGLYVRDCATGEWVNAKHTLFEAQSDLVQDVSEGEYTLGHFYGNIVTDALLDGQFDCQTDPPSFTTVTAEGGEQQVQRVGEVEFAYVVEHRQ